MAIGDRLRARVADGSRPGSLGHRARARRAAKLLASFPGLAGMSVLDLGGEPHFWRTVAVRPARVTILNLMPCDPEPPWLETVIGDACAPPPALAGRTFDLVVSNSVIEHVGGHGPRQRFAEVVQRAADRHWVQTPYRYFPVEPHWVFPGMQFLPLRMRAEVTRRWPLSPGRADNLPEAIANAASVELLSLTEMRAYFPESRLWYERAGGLIKSVTAIRD
ncbi:class I SAM-dependent methyltransferase [Actinoplanes sp. RD1]|uniref:class I SAM-dependent methyltransferase n=1 Tax=Actinoplanes sp. RD1 TaxID=3064538 RepID=UPI0027411BA3|nr:class I SAM-dependent methyltransferase [Actinoplanes sp. RD1]